MRVLLCAGLLVFVAQAQPRRIQTAIDNTRRFILTGSVHRHAVPANDTGPVEPSFALPGLTLRLKLSAAQQSELDRLLRAQQDPSSSEYHKWLTPEEYADRFGISPNDIASISRWLEQQGFTVTELARGRAWIVFRGTAQQVQGAFRTSLRHYLVDGKIHYANATDPSIPAALADLVSGIGGLDDFLPEPESSRTTPLPDFTSANGSHFLAPNDLALIYDVVPLHNTGIDGTGQKIAIVGQSNLVLSDVETFRSRFNLPAQDPQVVLVPNLPDPGVSGALVEAELDVQWAGAMAPNASIIYVYSSSFLNALAYVVDQNLAPVVSASYYAGCEQQMSFATMTFYRQLAQRANAQGITWVNSGGDAGAAGCDPNSANLAQNGLAARFPASIPEVTAVGGTQFDEQGGAYWNPINDSNGASAVSYIPETVWNEGNLGGGLLTGGGGVSTFFPKPAWQIGPGVPNDSFRDLPDVALSAAVHDGYYLVFAGRAVAAAGTSAGAPAFAGMLALLNQYLAANGLTAAPGLGNVNPILYALAQNAPGTLHDVVNGSNRVACAPASPNCANGNFGYDAGPGYDEATGLGSPDLFHIAQQWNTQRPANALVVVSLNKNPVYQQTPDANGNLWTLAVTLTEEAGIGATLKDFTINGQSQLNSFKDPRIPPNGNISATLGYARLSVPAMVQLAFTGVDDTGQSWMQQVSVPFLGPPPVPAVTAAGNAASYQQAAAPGMLLTILGSNLASGTEAEAAIPFLTFLHGFSATINGVIAPVYYVSPTQVTVQVPYQTQPGPARLLVSDGLATGSFSFQVAAAAPGIFADQNHQLVPSAAGRRGDILTLFITGEGQVTPALPNGATPAASTPIANLPVPQLPVALTIGNEPATIEFAGIASGLVGVTQINFQIPADAALGPQPVVVTVGTVSSPPATLTVTQ